jgi:hypothetical protein
MRLYVPKTGSGGLRKLYTVSLRNSDTCSSLCRMSMLVRGAGGCVGPNVWQRQQ